MKRIIKLTALVIAGLAALGVLGLFALVPELPGYLVYKAKSVFAVPAPPERDLTRLEFYKFVPGSRLEDRIGVMPPALLAFFKNWDKAPEYQAYLPSAAEKALFMQYFRLLPPVYRQVFDKRCVGVYFVSNLKGNGVTSWVRAPGNAVYFHMALNPAALKAGLSATLTARERSCFKGDAAVVAVEAGFKYKGLLYALFHEATHAVDYVKGITPYADDTMPVELRPASGRGESFFRAVWADFYVPLPVYDYPLREDITFYGLGGGPKMDVAVTPLLYAGLRDSGFASLYGSRSWSEDLAELATMQLLTKKLGQPYRIKYAGAAGAAELRPLSSKNTAGRAEQAMALIEAAGRDALD